MKYSIVTTSKDEAVAANRLSVMLQAADKLGVKLDHRDFTEAWLQPSTRVFMATTDDLTEPTGFAIMAYGKRYYDADMSASIVVCEGPERSNLLQFIADTCKVLGVEYLFFEGREGDTIESESSNLRMHRVN